MEYAAFAAKYDVDMLRDDGMNPIFRAVDVARMLGLRNCRTSIALYKDGDDTVRRRAATKGGTQLTTFLTLGGLTKLLCQSRKPVAIQIAACLDIDVKRTCLFAPAESCSLAQIQEAFAGEHMSLQHYIAPFFNDMYLPRYRQAIECDERTGHGHGRYPARDEDRERTIVGRTGCTFIRYDPHAPDFCIMRVVCRIHRHMMDTERDRGGSECPP